MYLYIHNFNILNKPTIKQKGFHWSEKILILESLQEKKKKCSFSQPSGFMAGPDHNRYKII